MSNTSNGPSSFAAAPRIVEKVVAYATFRNRLLVFTHPKHPEAGLQVPAGTIEPDESPYAAVLRELREETGLASFASPRYLGTAEFDMAPFGRMEVHRRHFFSVEVHGPVRETWRHEETSGGHSAPKLFEFKWVPLGDVPALIAGQGALLGAMTASVPALSFDAGPADGPVYAFPKPDEQELETLRVEFDLASMVPTDAKSLERLTLLCRWVHSRWEHDGGTASATADALSILRGARAGGRFRCIEFATVLAAVGTAMGHPTRSVHLMKATVETDESGAGHAVNETWIPEHEKWVMADPQWNAIPYCGDTPLNCVELAVALSERSDDIRLRGKSSDAAMQYLDWIRPYLFYMTVTSALPGPKTLLRLAPHGAVNPTVFQRKRPLPPSTLTASIARFYPPAA